MRKQDNKIELMAPAGSWEALQAAIDNGADSIYFGVEQLNMRAVSSINFELDDLPEIVNRCNANGVRSYLTLNTIVYDHDLLMAKKLINAAKEAGVSAVIVADQAVMFMAREAGLEVHISTQINITNVETLKFYSTFADTMVLSRELSLRQVKHITDEIKKQQIKGPSGRLVEIEIFGHGALCMAVSGKCHMSLHTYNSSANRGACKQNCRKPYLVIDKESGIELEIDNEYIMSPKDLMVLDFLDQVKDAGVKVLKLEGRGRAPEYVATTVKAYREAIDSLYDGTFTPERIDQWVTQLSTVYNRGFWSGYYLGKKLGEWTTPGSHATQKKIYLGKGWHYYPKAQVAEFKIEAFDLKKGDKILITGPTTGVVEKEIEEMYVNDQPGEAAQKGDIVSIKIDKKIRPADKLYKLIKAEAVS
ncbi:MAG TPA: U32 family peptidase [Flavobacteriales bacterium]|jgi:putative protease|nr:U32 family peptidase [Flavobacteriales bacterium]